jgi:hypothetical protein
LLPKEDLHYGVARHRRKFGISSVGRVIGKKYGPAAATIMRAPFGLSDASELNQLLEVAGFRDIKVHQRVGSI